MAAAVVNDPAKWKGQSIPVVGQHISNLDVAQIISNVTGKTVRRAFSRFMTCSNQAGCLYGENTMNYTALLMVAKDLLTDTMRLLVLTRMQAMSSCS